MAGIEAQAARSFYSPYSGEVSKRDEIDQKVKETFAEGYQSVTLHKGMVLHRLCDKKNPMGQFWLDDNTFRGMINHLQRHMTGHREPPKRGYIRNELALLTQWNQELTHRIKITLERDFMAYVGEVGRQSSWILTEKSPFRRIAPPGARVEKKIEYRYGGVTQYVIPALGKVNLNKTEDLGFTVNVNMAHIFRPSYGRGDLHKGGRHW